MDMWIHFIQVYVRFLQRYVKRLFCILPFEPAFSAKHGVQVDYIGNPLVDRCV